MSVSSPCVCPCILLSFNFLIFISIEKELKEMENQGVVAVFIFLGHSNHPEL